jgi:non-specific serine/threonine protein kinase
MSVRVFVSYRRDDSRQAVGRLRDRLADAFGEQSVFLDVDSIDFGFDFRTVMREAIDNADAVVAVVGPGFNPARLAEPDDYVRQELSEAFALGKLIVPVLVEDARMPTPKELPADLEPLSYLNDAPLRPDPDFRLDATRLIESLERVLRNRRSITSSQRDAVVAGPPDRELSRNAEKSSCVAGGIDEEDRPRGVSSPPDAPGDRTATAEPLTAGRAHNLPRPRSSFVGRQGELDELEKLLEVPGLLTVVGPGGVGKTRLAVEVGRRLVGSFSGGVWLVELAPLRDPSLVPHAVAAALGVSEERDRPLLEKLTAALVARRTLLLLDNCEHLADAAAALIDAGLAAAADLTVLATSREPLRVEGEVVWRTPSLPVPRHHDLSPEAALSVDSVRLFCERAATHSRLVLDADNAPAVAELCRRLDGIPLAIELAAARSGALAPADMLARLEDRFVLLTQGRRTDLPRHQTLQAAIGWSYDLLRPAEQTLFRRLSVFAGGFTIEDAQILAGDTLDACAIVDLLANLVERSLVETDESGAASRYRLLESLSAFGRERLRRASEEATVRTRHLELFAHLGEDLVGRLRSDDAAWALARFDEAQADVRAAFEWSLQHDPGAALTLIASLACYWIVRGQLLEAHRSSARALAADGDSVETRAAALCAAGHISCALGRFDEALDYLDKASTLGRRLGGGVVLAEALGGLAWVAFEQGRYDTAQRVNEESLAEWSRSGADHGFIGTVAEVLHNLGILAFERGEFAEARDWFQKSLSASEKVGPIVRVAPLYGLGKVARAEGQLDLATQMFNESAAIAERVGFPRWVAFSHLFLASIARRKGDLDLAHVHLRHAVALSARLGDRICLAWCLETLGGVAATRSEFRRAASLLGAAASLREGIGALLQPSERDEYDATVSQTTAGLAKEQFIVEWNKGRNLALNEVIVLAEG